MIRRNVAAFAAVILLLSGCGSTKEETVKEHQEKEIENVQKETVETKKAFPLTGIGTREDTDARAVAVMVNNHPKARPQSGLDKADIVFELLAEGNVTRFLAVFQSQVPETIGPVRSAREYYIELAKGYDSLFIAHGYSHTAKELLDRGVIDHINGIQYDGSLFKRASSRVAPHNSYITYDNILKGADQLDYSMKKAPESLTFLSKDEVAKLEGPSGKSVTVSYYNDSTFSATYEYDAESSKYKRFPDGEQTIDNETGNPVLLDNVFIVEANHQIIDSGAGLRRINLTSGGKAYLLQKGFVREVEWKSEDGRIVPVINGTVTGFVPGKTWINIVPSNPGLTSMVNVEAN